MLTDFKILYLHLCNASEINFIYESSIFSSGRKFGSLLPFTFTGAVSFKANDSRKNIMAEALVNHKGAYKLYLSANTPANTGPNVPPMISPVKITMEIADAAKTYIY